MKKRMLCSVLCCVAILLLTATSAFAADSLPELDRSCSIAFVFSAGGSKASGGSLELRQVAVWNASSQRLEWTEDFSLARMPIDALYSSDTAGRLLLYARAAWVAYTKVQVDEDGTALAEGLKPGVYLMSQDEPFEGYTALTPALIFAPMSDAKGWIYDVDAMPKLEPLMEETTAPTTSEPTPPDLPQTGQINWPVPILALMGSVLILLGICLRKDKRHESKA